MSKKLSLQTKMIGSFLFMGSIALVVGTIGWSGNLRLSGHINTLGNNTLPSVTGLWKLNEGQTQVQSSQRALLNPLLNREKRQAELARIDRAFKQIDEGFTQYLSAPQTDEEKVIYKKMLEEWDKWKSDHQKFMYTYQQFVQLGILNPKARIEQLALQGKQNSPEMAAAKTADALLFKLSNLDANQQLKSFNQATEAIIAVIKYNE